MMMGGACGIFVLALVVGLMGMGTKNGSADMPTPTLAAADAGDTALEPSQEEDNGTEARAVIREEASLAGNQETEETEAASANYEETSSLSESEEDDFTEAEASLVLEDLRDVFPEGAYWNHVGVEDWNEFTITDTPCQHDVYWDTYCNTYTGGIQELFPQFEPMEQCLGFAALLSDLVFGADAPVSTFSDYTQLRVGDNIRLELSEHSMVVLTVDLEGITVVECNSDYEHCRISWDRFLSWDDLEAYSYEILCISRYEG